MFEIHHRLSRQKFNFLFFFKVYWSTLKHPSQYVGWGSLRLFFRMDRLDAFCSQCNLGCRRCCWWVINTRQSKKYQWKKCQLWKFLKLGIYLIIYLIFAFSSGFVFCVFSQGCRKARYGKQVDISDMERSSGSITRKSCWMLSTEIDC